MTCPHCGRTVRAELLLLALHHGLDPHQFTRLYEDTIEAAATAVRSAA